MLLGDIYKHKEKRSIIQIDSFATPMENRQGEFVIVFREINENRCPSLLNKYGTQEEIENEYELLVPQEDLKQYDDWDDIFDKIK